LEMDITVPAGAIDLLPEDPFAGKSLLIDLSFGEPTATTYVNRASKRQGFVAEEREKTKRQHYQPEQQDPTSPPRFDAERYVLVPFTMETYGALGATGHSLLHKLARHCAGGPQDYDIVAYNLSLREMRVRLAVGLQKLLYDRSCRHRALASPRPVPHSIRRSATLTA
jgi:hypothetical protein